MKELNKCKLAPMTTNEIKPMGWLKRQLEIQAAGLSGNLDKVWPDVRDSHWIGGDREGWERVPYWLDGFIPLAFLLDDEDLKSRAKKYIDAILSNQQDDGWICPCDKNERARYDMWALFLICKVLVLYYECSGDERVEEAVYKAYKNLYTHIDTGSLFNWAASRWYEALISIFWLYERRPESWMLKLCYKLELQGMDFEKLFADFRMQEPDPHDVWSFLTHVVNLAMALKSGALLSRLDGRDAGAFAENALSLLQKYHGMPTGHFTGDECLSGTSPIQGSECCGVAEAMYSYEQLIAMTGDIKWADRLERLAFNAFPATISPDMWSHQYNQMTNQVECSRLPDGIRHFRTNRNDAHMFGLEPNFGCCTANFSQAFPKFALASWMKTPDGIACVSPVPALVKTTINQVDVQFETQSLYPFRDTASIQVTVARPTKFALYIRIPAFASSAKVDGKQVPTGGFFKLERDWEGSCTVMVELGFVPCITVRPSKMVCVNRGPLLFSIGIKENWERLEYSTDDVQRVFPYCDYNITAQSGWNYALVSEHFELEHHPLPVYPFSPDNPALSLTTKVVEIDWRMQNGLCTELPASTIPLSLPVDIKLIPYGCTNLRITELPFITLDKEYNDEPYHQ